ncbi:hypothetical protein LQ757_12270 [Agromyces sp. SYSU K20354]|uniref:hypothetical protein n=1 Tax=Agromyces cavernae TaxID=2898659 RepID=UPI001E2A1784|nr:hypothetical protein [Agromyces cavernae]MCD2443049.1 hypothetical protein [Agromyces cavernae]
MSGALSEADGDTGASGPVAPDRAFDLRARVVETVVLVTSVVVLRLLGVLLLVVSSYGLGSTDALFPLIALVADPNLLTWVALTAVVQFGLRSMRRPGRWALILLAAPVAVLLATAVRSLPSLAGAGLAAVLGSGIAWIDAGILTAVVALGIVFSAAFLGRERRTSARIAGGLLALGGLLTLVLLWQAFETYFTIWGSPVVVTPAQEDRYLVTAALTLGAYVGAIVFAAVSRRRGLIITACIIGCLGVILAFAVPVPADRFFPEPAPAPEVPRGPTCMGEGDPNCIGG